MSTTEQHKYIYRVIVKTTSSVQPGRGGTDWQTQVLYVGVDRLQARIVYFKSAPEDFGGSHGNRARVTVLETLDADADDLTDQSLVDLEEGE